MNARTVAGQLHCSTQPVMYHFATIEGLKQAAYAEADRMHTEYLMSIPPFPLSVSIRLCQGKQSSGYDRLGGTGAGRGRHAGRDGAVLAVTKEDRQ